MTPTLEAARQLATATVSIVLATYNERENIDRMLEGILRCVRQPVEIIVVDDDSPDGTAARVAELDYPQVKLIQRKHQRGLAAAFLRGIRESEGQIVGWMDADASMPPELLPAMISRLGEYDAVIGSRYAPGGRDARGRWRRHASLLINGFADLVLRCGIKDYTSGFVVLKRSVLDEVSIAPTGHGEYFIELVYGCHRRGMKMLELPYVFRNRSMGASKSAPSPTQFARLGLHYIRRVLSVRFRRGEAEAVLRPSFKRVDDRGVLRELINSGQWRCILHGSMRRGAVLGNHYHKQTELAFFLLHGRAAVCSVDVETGRRWETRLRGQQGLLLPPAVAHAIRFTRRSDFLLLKSLPYNAEEPDTFPYQVWGP